MIKIRAQKTHCGGEGLYMWRVSCILSQVLGKSCGLRGEFIRDGVWGEWGLYVKLGTKCWAVVPWH